MAVMQNVAGWPRGSAPSRIPSERRMQSSAEVIHHQNTTIIIWNLRLPSCRRRNCLSVSAAPREAETLSGAWLVSEGRATLRGRIQAGTVVIIVKKECTTLLGQRKALVKT